MTTSCSDAEPLDLSAHAVEEWPGKRVTINGTDYLVGNFLGSGGERFVHRLINCRSGLDLFVLKVLRDQLNAAQLAATALELTMKLHDSGKPLLERVTIEDAMVVHAHNGVFEIQRNAGGPAPGTDAARLQPVVDEATKLTEAGRHREARPLYESVLAENPSHTIALHHLAIGHLEEGELSKAFEYCRRALDIDTNVRAYLLLYIQLAAQLDAVRLLVPGLEDLRTKYPYERSVDELAIRLFLAVGDINSAANWLEGATRLPPELRSELEDETAAAREGAKRAAPLVEQARAAVMRAAVMEDLESARIALDSTRIALEAAHELHPQDPLLAANVGLSRRREGETEGALGALVRAARLLPEPLATYCWANASFAAIEGGDWPIATTLLDMFASGLRGLGSDSPWDLPGVAIWLEGGGEILEEPPASALAILRAAQEHFGPGAPLTLSDLLASYEAATVAYAAASAD
jgi:tetratricopeptide (TPR) repeat protein